MSTPGQDQESSARTGHAGTPSSVAPPFPDNTGNAGSSPFANPPSNPAYTSTPGYPNHEHTQSTATTATTATAATATAGQGAGYSPTLPSERAPPSLAHPQSPFSTQYIANTASTPRHLDDSSRRSSYRGMDGGSGSHPSHFSSHNQHSSHQHSQSHYNHRHHQHHREQENVMTIDYEGLNAYVQETANIESDGYQDSIPLMEE